jgi:hypothetical protein
MKTKSFDLYGGLLPAGFVQDNEHPVGKSEQAEERFWTGNPVKELPESAKQLKGIILSISSFGPRQLVMRDGLHVGVWLSWGTESAEKEAENVFAFGNTGDSGVCNISIGNLDILIPTREFRINSWAHNMRDGPADWHVNGVLFYEDIERCTTF